MRFRLAQLAALLLCLTEVSTVPRLLAKKKNNADVGPNEQKRAVHALNRLTFGARPGDVQQVMAMGVDRWIDLQLHPDRISDSGLEARLEPMRSLHMSSKEILENFPDGQMIRQVAEGKRPMPDDPVRRAIYQVQVARLEEKQEKEKKEQKAAYNPAPAPAAPAARAASPAPDANGAKTEAELAAAAAASPDAPAGDDGNRERAMASPPEPRPAPKPTPEEKAEARRREDRLYADLKVQSLLELPPGERYKRVLAMSADEQIAFADSLRGSKGQEFVADMSPAQREVLLAMNNPQQVVVEELSQAKLIRAIYSERQLEEVMTDFWFNHFNVFVGKGPERLLLTNSEQEVIRPRALGKFEDLLVATAKSPAMLFYLDNWLSVGPNSLQALGGPPRPVAPNGPSGRPHVVAGANPNARRRQNAGLNENYGRELLELHTLSVNGGYTQRDVTEVAKVFTGWTLDNPNEGMVFKFDPRKHEPGPKFVLGKRIKPAGEDEGRQVLHMLATSRRTAHFISLKLAQRFVADDPPPALVDRMAKTFLKKKGDIREVLTTLFRSPEFWADGTYRAKVKTPLEFVASAVRATGASVEDAMPLIRQLNNMGMPLYGAQPPTGYSMKAQTWVSSSALLTRMNFALALTAGKLKGVKVDSIQLEGGPPPPTDATVALTTMEANLLAADVSRQTHDSIVAQMQTLAKTSLEPEQSRKDTKAQPPGANRPPDANLMAGLLLGSPEFQRR
jgi:uncharacterized protein (DUF1800 family)